MISTQQQLRINTSPFTVITNNNMLRSDDNNEFRIVSSADSRKRSLHQDVAAIPLCLPPATKKRKKLRRSVRFSEESNQVSVLDTSSSSSSSSLEEDPRSTWYQHHDIASFKQDSKNSIYELHRAQGNLSIMSPDHCIRGLEHVITPRAALAQKRIRQERVHAVLFQQQLQRATATSNPELLKLVSCMFSQPRCDEAVRMGAQDCLVWMEE